jgi:hypothetical protein
VTVQGQAYETHAPTTRYSALPTANPLSTITHTMISHYREEEEEEEEEEEWFI